MGAVWVLAVATRPLAAVSSGGVEQGGERGHGNEASGADLHGFELPVADQAIERRATEAGRLRGFPNGVDEPPMILCVLDITRFSLRLRGLRGVAGYFRRPLSRGQCSWSTLIRSGPIWSVSAGAGP